MEKAEIFINSHKKYVLCILAAIMALCFVYSEICGNTRSVQVNSQSYIILNEAGKKIGENSVTDDKIAMEIATIYLKNHFRTSDECDYCFSDKADRNYIVYQNRRDIPFSGYYKLYPHAEVNADGNINLLIHRIF